MEKRHEGSALPVWIRFAIGLMILLAGAVLAWWLTRGGRTIGWLAVPVALLMSGRLLLLPLLGCGNLREPRAARYGTVQHIRRPDGTELRVERYGLSQGPTLILTHGWPVDSTEWFYLKHQLADRFRIIVWDLPGQGKSSPPRDHDYRVVKMASDLEAVVALAGPSPIILIGHSLGGMIVQEFCLLYPEHRKHIAGIVLAHTTYTDPLATMAGGGFLRALQKPIFEPMFHSFVGLWPVVWLMAWLNYISGCQHLFVLATNFAGRQTRGQVDYLAWLFTVASPRVVGRGALGSLAFDAWERLPEIDVPALVITGREDRITRRDAGLEIHKSLPRSQWIDLAPAGHMGPWEQNEAFARAVSDFAQKVLANAKEFEEGQRRGGAAEPQPSLHLR